MKIVILHYFTDITKRICSHWDKTQVVYVGFVSYLLHVFLHWISTFKVCKEC